MEKYMLAAVDIGSNSARLLIKSINKKLYLGEPVSFYKELFFRMPLRLGMDVFTIGEISAERQEMMIHTMKAFKQLMKSFSVTNYRICATSAMREAKNGKEVVKKVEKETGLCIEIISGEEEASIVYEKNLEGFEHNLDTYAYVDVGGGSTEIILVKDKKMVYQKSFRIGTLRMLNPKNEESDLAVMEEMKSELTKQTEGLDHVDIIGSGGNINKLYKLSPNKSKKTSSFTISTLTTVYESLKPLSVEKRMTIYSLRRERADVIVPAAEIFLSIAGIMKSQRIYVPMLGLADGIIDKLYAKLLEKK